MEIFITLFAKLKQKSIDTMNRPTFDSLFSSSLASIIKLVCAGQRDEGKKIQNLFILIYELKELRCTTLRSTQSSRTSLFTSIVKHEWRCTRSVKPTSQFCANILKKNNNLKPNIALQSRSYTLRRAVEDHFQSVWKFATM